jgi:ketosteroid isomerase-like protein
MQTASSVHPNLQLVYDYFHALEQGADEARLESFFAPDVRQHEFPNRLVDAGAERGLSELLAGSRKGKQVIENQRYVVKSALASDDRVALELEWTGQLKVPLANTPVGGTLRARCGVFFGIREGRIVEQHNYDCFDRF